MLSGIEPSASILRRVAEAAENAASFEKEVAVGRVKPLSMFRAGWIRTRDSRLLGTRIEIPPIEGGSKSRREFATRPFDIVN